MNYCKIYIKGPDQSAEFYVQEGQHINITCTGNIENALQTKARNWLLFYFVLTKLNINESLE